MDFTPLAQLKKGLQNGEESYLYVTFDNNDRKKKLKQMAVFKGNGNIFTHSKEHLKPLKVCVAPIRDKLNRSRILVRYDSRYVFENLCATGS